MDQDQLREALSRIAELASSVIDKGDDCGGHAHQDTPESATADAPHGCVVKALPQRLLLKAAITARMINPVNAPVFGPIAGMAAGLRPDDPQMLAVLTSKYWGPQLRQMTVSFMETTPPELRARIVSHMNAWKNCCGISFAETAGIGDVRISRAQGGYWSYLGTDIRLIPKNRPTMNLQGFTMSTPESEYKRVVRHEAGHTLGFPHEHMRKALVDRIDPAKAYAWFLQTYGWDKATVDAQVLTPLSEASLMATPPDQTSIMCYQLPGAITKDSKPITGGTNINATDCRFAGKIYPRPGRTVLHAEPAEARAEDDWPEEEDVEDFV